mmetsp:Transcript_15808/g.36493  ORF Transcript_15808/g.36493 Transcript_15808/m.36493 type:complete len:309 (+) Transcript_15808:628-1554(+)
MFCNSLVHIILLPEGNNDFIKSLVADQPPPVGADELEVMCGAWGCVREFGVDGYGLVHRVLCHLAVCRPLSAADRHKAPLHNVHHVVPGELLGVVGVGPRGADEGAEAGPGGSDVRVVHWARECAVTLVQDKVYLLDGAVGLRGERLFDVSRPRYRRSLPRQEVQHSAVLSEPNHAHMVGAKVVRHDKVGPLGRHNDLADPRIGHLAHSVGKGTRGVDGLLGLDFKCFTGKSVLYLRAGDLVALLPQLALGGEPQHLGVVEHVAAVLRRRQRNVEVHPGVVLLPIVQHNRPLETVRVDGWELVYGLGT